MGVKLVLLNSALGSSLKERNRLNTKTSSSSLCRGNGHCKIDGRYRDAKEGTKHALGIVVLVRYDSHPK